MDDGFAIQVAKEIEERIPDDLNHVKPELRRAIVSVVKNEVERFIYSKPQKYAQVNGMATRVNNVRVSDEEKALLDEARKLIFKSESVPYGEVIEHLARRYIAEQTTDPRDTSDADHLE